MAVIEILLPKMGESVAEATITKFVVNAGEQTEADEPLVEIATDKVDSEVPAPEDGTLVEWLVQEGDVVAVGQAIAKFEIDGDADAAPASGKCRSQTGSNSGRPSSDSDSSASPSSSSSTSSGRSTASTTGCLRSAGPAACAHRSQRSILFPTRSQHCPIRGRHTRGIGWHRRLRFGGASDQKRHFGVHRQPRSSPAATAPVAPPASAPAASTAPTVSVSGQDEIVEMDRMRKLIADHMVRSKQTSPHVTSFVEADMTKIVEWRKRNKAAFEQAHGTKLTFTPLIAEAIVKAIRDFPGVNASVDGDRIIIKKQINLGMATALPSGNLIVPVIHNADQLSLVGLATRVNDLADRARTGKLKPDDTAGGTYTMSNVGTFGNVMGTPIINQPQVGILALGAIRKKPAVIETPEGDMIGIRHMMFLSHSYDHRVVDGMLGGSFVKRVATYLEEFDLNRSVV